MSVGGFLCALRAQDWGNYFELYIFVMDKVCQLLGNTYTSVEVIHWSVSGRRVVECGLYITVFVCLYSCISESNIWANNF